jgi:hypothetical protein
VGRRGLLPGPGNYENQLNESLSKTAPKYGFGTASRDSSEEKKRTLPGPG